MEFIPAAAINETSSVSEPVEAAVTLFVVSIGIYFSFSCTI